MRVETVERRRVSRPRRGAGKVEAARRPGEGGEIDERPRSVYEVLTRRMLEEMREDVAEVKGRVNALLWLVAGSILADVLAKLLK